MQIDRLFEIVYLLLDKKKMTAAVLAAHFEVSKRTILRDIDTLTMAGIPIYTTKGKGGGIAILDNFILNKTAITEEEQSQILMALQSLTPTQHIDTGSLLSKLGALFEKTDAAWIEVDFSRWGSTGADREKFEILKQAVLKKQPISFTYPSSYGEITSREVYPLKLVFKAKAWYIQAFCPLKQDYRTFKINRMLQLTLGPGSFAGQAFAPPSIVAETPAQSALVPLKLVFSADVAYRVYDEFDTKNVQKNKDGSFTVTIELPNDSWLYGFLLSFGTAVRVVEPKHVQDCLLAQIEAIQFFYTGNKK